MKKVYTTPTVVIERYELTQTIASCATKIGFVSSECVLKDKDSTDTMESMALYGWFTNGACDYAVSGTDGEDGLCYHTSANASFNS